MKSKDVLKLEKTTKKKEKQTSLLKCWKNCSILSSDTEQKCSFLKLIHSSWRFYLTKELSSDYFRELECFVQLRNVTSNISPRLENIFRWSHLCPIETAKVVLVGQDPFSNPELADGLCFSVKKGRGKIPRSLRNIFTKLGQEFPKDFEVCTRSFSIRILCILRSAQFFYVEHV